MSVAEEESRAAEYRARASRRRANDEARLARLRGSEAARRQLQEDWQPLIDHLSDGALTGGHDDDQAHP